MRNVVAGYPYWRVLKDGIDHECEDGSFGSSSHDAIECGGCREEIPRAVRVKATIVAGSIAGLEGSDATGSA
jgi:hypothetical protein